mmetsp:Transcript_5049/g.14890  ORF Transcript_5049/g.14890 Transcript_5049/m.14890 type:complete len:286 (+) Transcript_5049:41-898(+)
MSPLDRASGMADRPVVEQAAVTAFARELALSLAAGADMTSTVAAATCRDVLAAEGFDMMRSEGVAATAPLRVALVAAAREATEALPLAATRLVSGRKSDEDAVAVKVEVRGNAGRQMRGAFTIGSSHGCDVQVGGDPTVEHTQLLVVPMPGGAIVADAWSGGGSGIVARGREGRAPVPVLGPVLDGAFVVEPGETVEVEIGSRTTVTIAVQAAAERPLACGLDITSTLRMPLQKRAGTADTASTGCGLSREGSMHFHSPSGRSSDRSRSPTRRLCRLQASDAVEC